MMIKESKRYDLLDFIRAVAIICVVVDHAFSWLGLLPAYQSIHNFLIFSVCPLIFMAGFTASISFGRRENKFGSIRANWRGFIMYHLKDWWRKSSPLLLAYVIATACTALYQMKSVNLGEFWNQLITFPHQFYFILIYLELMAVAPFVCLLWRRVTGEILRTGGFNAGNIVYLLLVLGIVMAIAGGVSYIHLWPRAVYEPGRQLFGGIELFVFAGGSLTFYLYRLRGKLKCQYWHFLKSPMILLMCGILLLIYLYLSHNIQFIFQHPPTFITITYCLAVGLILTSLYLILKYIKANRSINFFTFIGKHSLDIFLYHALFLEIMARYWPSGLLENLIWWRLPIFTFLAIGCSLIFNYVINFMLAKLYLYLQKLANQYILIHQQQRLIHYFKPPKDINS